MNRILLMTGRNFFRVPGLFAKLLWVADHADKYPETERYALVQKIARYANKGGRVTVVPSGLENIPQTGSFIMYPNHQGLFDMMAIVSVCDRPLSVVNKAELDNTPVLKDVFRTMKAIGIHRDDLKQSMQVILEVIREVKAGRNFVIFPEGTRSKEGNHLLEFKAGAFKAATKAQCPIVPVALIDSYKALDTGNADPLTVKVCFLPPLLPETYGEMKSQEIAKLVHDQIQEKIDSYTPTGV